MGRGGVATGLVATSRSATCTPRAKSWIWKTWSACVKARRVREKPGKGRLRPLAHAIRREDDEQSRWLTRSGARERQLVGLTWFPKGVLAVGLSFFSLKIRRWSPIAFTPIGLFRCDAGADQPDGDRDSHQDEINQGGKLEVDQANPQNRADISPYREPIARPSQATRPGICFGSDLPARRSDGLRVCQRQRRRRSPLPSHRRVAAGHTSPRA